MSKRAMHLGILTGGGDCPGLNAVIRAVVKSAILQHIKITGFKDGFRGLVNNDHVSLDYDQVQGILTQGGTILGSSNKDDPFAFIDKPGKAPRDRSKQALNNLSKAAVDGLIVLGGDGSLTIADRFRRLGVPIVGVPKTIDNDLVGTELTFGFDSAVSTAVAAIDRLHTTAASHHRVMVTEVMGRRAGWLALASGLASGADLILIPELSSSLKGCLKVLEHRARQGRRSSIVVVAEGATPLGKLHRRVVKNSPDPLRLGGVAEPLARALELASGIECRSVCLGHVVRGGSPTATDRNLATLFGVAAIELAKQKNYGRMVALKNGTISDVPLELVSHRVRMVDTEHLWVKAGLATGVSFGSN